MISIDIPWLKRSETTFADAERLLWKHLRAKRLGGYKFRRQEPIGNNIVDFVCQEKKVVIEADGGQHSEEREKDIERDSWLGRQGYKVCVSGIMKF